MRIEASRRADRRHRWLRSDLKRQAAMRHVKNPKATARIALLPDGGIITSVKSHRCVADEVSRTDVSIAKAIRSTTLC